MTLTIPSAKRWLIPVRSTLHASSKVITLRTLRSCYVRDTADKSVECDDRVRASDSEEEATSTCSKAELAWLCSRDWLRLHSSRRVTEQAMFCPLLPTRCASPFLSSLRYQGCPIPLDGQDLQCLLELLTFFSSFCRVSIVRVRLKALGGQ